jgi:hypothetical protein
VERNQHFGSQNVSPMKGDDLALSLAVVGQNLSASRAKLLSMLLQTAQHGKVAFIQHRATVPLNVAAARAPFLLGAAVLGQSWR